MPRAAVRGSASMRVRIIAQSPSIAFQRAGEVRSETVRQIRRATCEALFGLFETLLENQSTGMCVPGRSSCSGVGAVVVVVKAQAPPFDVVASDPPAKVGQTPRSPADPSPPLVMMSLYRWGWISSVLLPGLFVSSAAALIKEQWYPDSARLQAFRTR